MDKPPECPRCHVAMTLGFVPDAGNHDGYLDAVWVEGVPEYGYIWGRVKVWGRIQGKVVTYRCPECGYLESYAPVVTKD